MYWSSNAIYNRRSWDEKIIILILSYIVTPEVQRLIHMSNMLICSLVRAEWNRKVDCFIILGIHTRGSRQLQPEPNQSNLYYMKEVIYC